MLRSISYNSMFLSIFSPSLFLFFHTTILFETMPKRVDWMAETIKVHKTSKTKKAKVLEAEDRNLIDIRGSEIKAQSD